MTKGMLLLILCLTLTTSVSAQNCRLDKDERAYFELSGIWIRNQQYRPMWTDSGEFSWGYIENYDTDASAIIDLGKPEESYSGGDIIEISPIETGEYHLLIDWGVGSGSKQTIQVKRIGDHYLEVRYDENNLEQYILFSGPVFKERFVVITTTIPIDLYRMPISSSGVINKAESGVVIEVIGETDVYGQTTTGDIWYKVKLSDGNYGWISDSDYQTLEEPTKDK